MKIIYTTFTLTNIFLGITLAPIIQIIEKYLYKDWSFLIWLFILIGIDTTTGIWKAYKKKEISSKSFGQVITKTIIYGIFLIVIHALQNYTINNVSNTIFDWVASIAMGTLIVREAISIFENLASIAPNMFPVEWIVKLKGIDLFNHVPEKKDEVDNNK